ncbi:uncharacterized protein [Atheta coriaria]|uniref:uncharacterized protein n=1 Tax=Dalotia coriaria TaxID=877792 RepID=UPI0031F428B2
MSEEFHDIVQDVARKEDIKNAKLALQSSSNKGDGYLGMVKFGQIVGTNKTLDVVLKCSHRNPKKFEDFIHKIYLNEIHFYERIAPTFQKFQDEHQVSQPWDNTAKFYGAIDEEHKETLVLGNLKSNGYDMWDRKQLMNEAHLKCALKTFAKFHGTSYAMQKLRPDLYKEITGTMSHDLFYEVIDIMNFLTQVKTMITDIAKVIFDPEEEKTYLDVTNKFAATADEHIKAVFNYHANDVILQGDCWCSNALYHYADMSNRTEPQSMKMLDFQLAKLGSPAMDLSYFFYAAASKECFDRLDYFLKFYHDCLSDHLAEFNLKAADVLTFDQLMEHWKQVSKFGLILTFGVRKVMFVESQDAPDFTESPEDFLDKMKMSPELENLYHQQIKELIVHFIDRKLI